MSSLPVIIITKNEAPNIRDCIESVKWADEIVVVDSGSSDVTLAICSEFTPPVYTHDWPELHYAFESSGEILHKTKQYSTAGAQMLFPRGCDSPPTGAVLRGFWSFVRSYVLRAGFLVGREGFILPLSNAEGSYYRYLNLMLLNQKS